MNIVFSYLAKRPDNYIELENKMRERAKQGFAIVPDAEVFASWDGMNWVIDCRPKDFWERYVLGINKPNQQ